MLSNIPKVSIMIPVYNREKIIRETLDCAVNQDYENFEIIIVDNCSIDKTYEILEEYALKYKNVKIYKNEKNVGPVKNWKIGLDKCKGKYCKILWSDDQISLDYLKKTVHILEKDKELGFIYTKTEIYSDKCKNIVYKYGETGKYKVLEFIKLQLLEEKSLPLSPGCALFRTEDLKNNLEIEIENPKELVFSKYGAGNDLLLFLKTFPRYTYFYYLDEVKSYFRAHENSFSISNNLDEYYTYSKVYYLKKLENQKLENLYFIKIYLKKKYKYMLPSIDFKFKLSILIYKCKRILLKIKKNWE